MKTIIFANETFELVSASKVPTIRDVAHASGYDLYDFYANPSKLKEEIYAYWHEWQYETVGDNLEVTCFGVYSANCNTFTITCFVRDLITNKEYIVYITKEHNRACEVTYDE